MNVENLDWGQLEAAAESHEGAHGHLAGQETREAIQRLRSRLEVAGPHRDFVCERHGNFHPNTFCIACNREETLREIVAEARGDDDFVSGHDLCVRVGAIVLERLGNPVSP